MLELQELNPGYAAYSRSATESFDDLFDPTKFQIQTRAKSPQPEFDNDIAPEAVLTEAPAPKRQTPGEWANWVLDEEIRLSDKANSQGRVRDTQSPESIAFFNSRLTNRTDELVALFREVEFRIEDGRLSGSQSIPKERQVDMIRSSMEVTLQNPYKLRGPKRFEEYMADLEAPRVLIPQVEQAVVIAPEPVPALAIQSKEPIWKRALETIRDFGQTLAPRRTAQSLRFASFIF